MVTIERRREISRDWARRARLDPIYQAKEKAYRQSEHGKALSNIRQKQSREKLRREVLIHYGSRCACCGYADLGTKLYGKSFLQLDHVYGNGSQERKEIDAARTYHHVRMLNYPDKYRILCAGCNNSMPPGADRCLLHGN